MGISHPFPAQAAVAAAGDVALKRKVARRLLAHPKTAKLEERWNLPVYFELVRGDLVSRLDAALEAPPDDGYVVVKAQTSKRGEPSDAFADILLVLEKTWSGDVVLKPVADKFLGLAFELVAKVCAATRRALEAASSDWTPASLGQLVFDLAYLCDHVTVQLPAGLEAHLDLPLDTEHAVAAGVRAALRGPRALMVDA